MNRITTDTTKTDEQLLCELIHAEVQDNGLPKDALENVIISCNGDVNKAYDAYIRDIAETLSKYHRLGTCPKCGSVMKRADLKGQGLLTLWFPALEKWGWVCVRCHEVVGCTSNGTEINHEFPMPVKHISIPEGMAFERKYPGDDVVLPYESPVYKWFMTSRHDCKLVIDRDGLTFTDPVDGKYSYHISASQLKRATFKQKGNVAMGIKLSNGSKYEIAYEDKYLKNKYEEILAAISLVNRIN